MLVDTGANINLMSVDTARRLPNLVRLNTNHLVKVASGELISSNEAIITDVKMGDGTIKNVKFIICKVSHELIMGFNQIENKLIFDRSQDWIQVDHCRIPFPKYGNQGVCSVIEEVTIEPESAVFIHAQNPLATLKDPESVARIENLGTGFLHENVITITEGIYTNSEYTSLEILNPWPYSITIPKGTEVARAITMEEKNGQLQCNELVEILSKEHYEKFIAHKEMRNKKYQPKLSDAYKNVELGEALTNDQIREMTDIMKDKREAFSTCEKDIGLIKGHQFAINLKDETKSIYLKPRPTPPAYVQQGRESINNWVDTNVIEPASSPHNIPLFFVPKKGGAVRPVLDCRWLNEETIPNRYPIPSLKGLMNSISELIGTNTEKNIYISSTDIQSAFNQLEMVEKDRPKCAFSWQGRQYRAIRTLFGLRNAPSAFSEIMVKITDGIPGCFVLLDDVLMIATSWEAHKQQVNALLDRCIDFGVTLKPTKTHIAKASIDYLGFRLSKEGIEPLESKVIPILNYPAPKSRKETRRFVGMCNFYSKFVKDGHRLLAPLFKMCGKSTAPFEWKSEQVDAFQKYKKALAEFVLLKHRDPNKKLVLITDGSIEGIAGGLHQACDDGTLEPLGFVSRALKTPEKTLASRYIELLAIIFCLEQFEYELTGFHVTVITDHKSLVEIEKEKQLDLSKPRIVTNALMRLQRWNISVIHRPNTYDGIIAIDALSRAIPLPQVEESDDEAELKIDKGVSNNIEEIVLMPKRRLKPKPCTFHLYNTESHSPDSDSTTDDSAADKPCIQLRKYAKRPIDDIGNEIENLQYSYKEIRELQEADTNIKKKIEKKICKKNNKGVYILAGFEWPTPLLLVPCAIKSELVSFLHQATAHLGIDRLESVIKRSFKVFQLRDTIAETIKTCQDCIINKPKPAARHEKPPEPDYGITPWSRFYTDLADFGQKDQYGNRYLLGIEDHLSRFIDAIPVPDKQAQTIAIGLSNLLLRHNCLNGHLIQDNGLEFNNTIQSQMHKLFNISVSRISPYNPSGNLIERRWKEIGIQARIQKLDKDTWSRDIMLMLYHINNSPCSARGYLTPSEILTGRPLELLCFPPPEEIDNYDEYSWIGHLSKWLYEIGVNLSGKEADKFECHINPKRIVTYRVGDRAAYWTPQRPGNSKKLHRGFSGTAQITKIIGNGCYEITDDHGRKYTRNVKFLRKLPDYSDN
jgi:hypothetical protein